MAKPKLAATMRRYLERIACVFRAGSVSGADLACRSFASFLMETAPDVAGNRHKEQVTRRDSTGRILAESDFFEPLTVDSLIVSGYGGRIYSPTNEGFITLQMKPATG